MKQKEIISTEKKKKTRKSNEIYSLLFFFLACIHLFLFKHLLK